MSEEHTIYPFPEPECPAGCGPVGRPNCWLEHPSCPRHEVKREWVEAKRAYERYASANIATIYLSDVI
jgi:hypothetical protein